MAIQYNNEDILINCLYTVGTLRWIDRCISAHKKPYNQNLFGIVQGGLDSRLRSICLEGLIGRFLFLFLFLFLFHFYHYSLSFAIPIATIITTYSKRSSRICNWRSIRRRIKRYVLEDSRSMHECPTQRQTKIFDGSRVCSRFGSMLCFGRRYV